MSERGGARSTSPRRRRASPTPTVDGALVADRSDRSLIRGRWSDGTPVLFDVRHGGATFDASDREFERVCRELSVQIDHRHLGRVVDAFVDAHGHCVVALVDPTGPSLAQVERVEPVRLLEWTVRLADALDELDRHDRTRRVRPTPEWIRLDTTGEPVLLDLGAGPLVAPHRIEARVVAADRSLLAPELLDGRGPEPSTATWTLARTLLGVLATSATSGNGDATTRRAVEELLVPYAADDPAARPDPRSLADSARATQERLGLAPTMVPEPVPPARRPATAEPGSRAGLVAAIGVIVALIGASIAVLQLPDSDRSLDTVAAAPPTTQTPTATAPTTAPATALPTTVTPTTVAATPTPTTAVPAAISALDPVVLAGGALIDLATSAPSVDAGPIAGLGPVVDAVVLDDAVWLVDASGRVVDAVGGEPTPALATDDADPVVAAVPADPGGLWLLTQRGRVFSFGAARALPAEVTPPTEGAPFVDAVRAVSGVGLVAIDDRGDGTAVGLVSAPAGTVGTGRPVVASRFDDAGRLLLLDDAGNVTFDSGPILRGSSPSGAAPVDVLPGSSATGAWVLYADGSISGVGDLAGVGARLDVDGPAVAFVTGDRPR